MTKEDAIRALRDGKSVRHKKFFPGDFISYRVGRDGVGRVVDEDGWAVNLSDFFWHKTNDEWNTGWEIFVPNHNKQVR